MYGGRTAGMFGYSHFTGGFAGGQAEYVRVPLGDVNLLAIPDGVPDEKALYLSDVLATSYNAVHDTAVYPGDSVAIFGAGPIGQMAGVFALKAGAAKVIFVDTEPRLTFVREHWPAGEKGKLELVDYKTLAFGVTTKPTVVSRLKELCGGRGPDAAIEVGVFFFFGLLTLFYACFVCLVGSIDTANTNVQTRHSVPQASTPKAGCTGWR